MPTSRPSSRVAPNPQALQFAPFTAEHFSTPQGLAFVNLQMSQWVNALNRATGQAGPVVMPAGVDVAGATVTGLGAPTGPGDAVSLAHGTNNYGAPAVAPQLDLGGANTLKGLSNLYLMMNQAFTGTITLAKLTVSGTEGSITVSGGLITKVVQST
jgi:hypothetical protein